MNILDKIVLNKKAEVAEAKENTTVKELEASPLLAAILTRSKSFCLTLRAPALLPSLKEDHLRKVLLIVRPIL